MTEANQKYGDDVRQHLDESFPNDSLPHTINLITEDWVNAIIDKCPPPKGMSDVDARTVVGDALYAWLTDKGMLDVGNIYVHPERRDAAQKAEADAAARKKQAEIAPLQALVKQCVTEVLVECGLVELKPQAKQLRKRAVKGHRH